MFLTEKELAIQVAHIDRVQINDVYLTEAGEHEVFQKFTSDSASANHQYPRLRLELISSTFSPLGSKTNLLDAAVERP